LKQLKFTWPAVAGADHYRILENPDGASGFTVIPSASNITATSHNLIIPVHKTDWFAAQYIVEACDVAETACVGSSNQTLALIDSISATGYIKASNTDANDLFGTSVALSGDGNTLAVGAQFEDSAATGVNNTVPGQGDNAALDAGAVYVYTRSGTTWSQQAYIKASNTDAFDHFGISVALSGDGNTLAVGANNENSAATGVNNTVPGQADNAAGGAGAVYVFTRSGTTWTQQAYVKASNTDASDNFGISVVLSGDGNTLAVGANKENSAATGVNNTVPGQGNNAANDAGAVYVFTRSGTAWTQQAYVKASNTEASDDFGVRVALNGDGNTLAVSARFEDSAATGVNNTSPGQGDNAAFVAGAVYVYTRSGTTWMQQAYVKASNTDAGDVFGRFISLSEDGNTLAVGAELEDSAATGVNNTIPGQGDNSAGNTGAVYVFTRSGTLWTQHAYVKATNTDAGDSFSLPALSGDGNTLVVGADSEDSAATGVNNAAPGQGDNAAGNTGAVYVFTRSGTTWTQQAYVKASNTEADDFFGTPALSSDGDTMAVTAFIEDSAATGVNNTTPGQGDNSASGAGAVYLY
jgi:hypothetical protein